MNITIKKGVSLNNNVVLLIKIKIPTVTKLKVFDSTAIPASKSCIFLSWLFLDLKVSAAIADVDDINPPRIPDSIKLALDPINLLKI